MAAFNSTRDVDNWLYLAGEVEVLFGPIVDRPDFHQAISFLV